MESISIKLPHYWICLTTDEIERLLKSDPTLWKAAIKRGKVAERTEKAMDRKPKGSANSRILF